MFKIEQELIFQLVKKEKEAYAVFYTKTVDVLFRYIKSHYFVRDEMIEDILSEFYLKFWRVVEKYDDEFKFESYIWVVFKSVIKDFFRKNQHQYTIDTTSLDLSAGNEKEMLHFMEENFQLAQIEGAMDQLNEIEREIIFLKFIESQTYEEMEVILGFSQEVLRQRVFRVLKKIKQII